MNVDMDRQCMNINYIHVNVFLVYHFIYKYRVYVWIDTFTYMETYIHITQTSLRVENFNLVSQKCDM